MKLIIGIAVFITMLFNCKNTNNTITSLQSMEENQQELMSQENAIDSIIYVASTRGFYEKVIISKKTIKHTNDRSESNFNSLEIEIDQWETLNASINEVGAENINKFKAPSEKHQVDGAALASLIIYSNGKEYESQRFDHKFPPKQLSAITDIIYKLTDHISKQ